MFYQPHKLYKVMSSPTKEDDKGNPIKGSENETFEYIDGCFLHNIGIQEMNGYLGKGISVSHFINTDRNRELAYGIEVVVMDGDCVIGRGKIEDIKHTSGHINNYTTIYI